MNKVCIPISELQKTGFTGDHKLECQSFIDSSGRHKNKELFDPTYLTEKYGVVFSRVEAISFDDIEPERLAGSQDFRAHANEDLAGIVEDIQRDGFDLHLIPPAVFEEEGKYYYINGRTRREILLERLGRPIENCVFAVYHIIDKSKDWGIFGAPFNNVGRRTAGLNSKEDNKKIVLNNLPTVFRYAKQNLEEFGKNAERDKNKYSDIMTGVKKTCNELLLWSPIPAVLREITTAIFEKCGVPSNVIFTSGEDGVVDYVRNEIDTGTLGSYTIMANTIELTQLMKKLSPEVLAKHEGKKIGVVLYQKDYTTRYNTKLLNALTYWRQLDAYKKAWNVTLPENVEILGIVPQIREENEVFPMDQLITREKAEQYLDLIGV
jgi:hypothetical protein